MFDKLRTALETAPEKLSDHRSRLVTTVRHRAAVARGEGHSRFWNAETRTLENAVDLLDRSKDLPVVKLVVAPAERIVKSRLDHVTELPVAEFATLNAKDAARAVRGLDWVELLRVRRFEAANKGRKTVLDALAKELDRLKVQPQAA